MACDENMTPNDVVQQEMGSHGALTYVMEGIKTYIDDAHVVKRQQKLYIEHCIQALYTVL